MEDSGTTDPREPLDVHDVLTFMIDQMAAIAWQKLGLQPDLATGRIEKDLAQAKIAIDVVTHLSTFIEPKLEADDKTRIHGLIRDLRLNFVQKTQEQTG
jgi:hypothetical protein